MTTWQNLFDRAADHDVRKTTASSSAVDRETQGVSRDDERTSSSRTTHQNAQRSEDADVDNVRAALAERRADDE